MEKHEFMPRSALPADIGPRDLPPRDACPLSPSPRMERPVEHPATDGCGCEQSAAACGPDSWGLTGYPLAMVYAPCQAYRALYDPAAALQQGTLFTELDLPLGRDCAGFSTVGCACRAERRGV